jgi:hypothetical protein
MEWEERSDRSSTRTRTRRAVGLSLEKQKAGGGERRRLINAKRGRMDGRGLAIDAAQ